MQETGFDPWYGRIPHAVEQLGPCATTTEPALQTQGGETTKPVRPRTCGLQQEKPLQWEARVPQLESSPHLLQPEKNPCSNKDPAQPKIKSIN